MSKFGLNIARVASDENAATERWDEWGKADSIIRKEGRLDVGSMPDNPVWPVLASLLGIGCSREEAKAVLRGSIYEAPEEVVSVESWVRSGGDPMGDTRVFSAACMVCFVTGRPYDAIRLLGHDGGSPHEAAAVAALSEVPSRYFLTYPRMRTRILVACVQKGVLKGLEGDLGSPAYERFLSTRPSLPTHAVLNMRTVILDTGNMAAHAINRWIPFVAESYR